jgi:sigma-B regulation protein RsbQ
MQNILERNNVTIIGEGKETLMFAHGFGCDQSAWKYIISAFSPDYKLILFDYVGSGNADHSAYDSLRYNSLNGYAEDIIEICKELKIENAVFIGHSVSCMIGVLVAIKNPTAFKKMVFIGPSPYYLNDQDYIGGFEKEDLDGLFKLMDDDYIAWSHSTAPAIMGKHNVPILGEELTESFCSMDPEIAKSFARVTFLSDNRKDLSYIPIESLTLQCSEDMIAPLEVGNYIKANTPNNKLVVLKATGHCPHMSAPEETIDAIKDFL